MTLRDYQEATITLTWSYLRANPGKNPCIVLPTGAGKSHVLAEMCRLWIQKRPDARLLMLTHVKELIEQNANKMRAAWPGGPLGIFSAGLKRKQLGFEITFAGIQSIWNKAEDVGHVTAVIIDECHLISAKDSGRYREFIEALKQINPKLRVIGLTATPWRLGHGVITEGDQALFHDLIEPTSILELIEAGHLAPLRSKHTGVQLLDLVAGAGVAKRGGDFVESELNAAVNTLDANESVAQEIIARAGAKYRHWLVFCTGVDHATQMAELLTSKGAPTAVVHGGMNSLQRTDVLTRFKCGELRAVTNVNVLTTGFDFPNIDLLALCRPTLSPTLYVQMAGRGMRLKNHTDHCMVLDFGGLVSTHGPITDVLPPKPKKTTKPGEAPTKMCPECSEIVAIQTRTCPGITGQDEDGNDVLCGFVWPLESNTAPPKLHNDDIIDAGEPRVVNDWRWSQHTSRSSGILMLRADYALSDGETVSEYFGVWHGGAGERVARHKLNSLSKKAGSAGIADELWGKSFQLCELLHNLPSPNQIRVKQDGKFFKVTGHRWGRRSNAA